MNKLLKWTKEGFRLAGLGLFQFLVLFWIAKAYYCARGYFDAGFRGMLGALLRGTAIPADLKEWDHPRCGFLLLRPIAIALMTVELGLLNRRTLRKFWSDLRQGLGAASPRPPHND
jgi:hypothetical protein